MRPLIRKSLFLGELSRVDRDELETQFGPLHAEYLTEHANSGWWTAWSMPSPASGQELAHFVLEKPSFECIASPHPAELIALQDMAKHYFRQAGLIYDFEKTDVSLRYWHITVVNQEEPVPSSQPVRCEDDWDKGLAFTCIMVCRKDEGVQGADLNVMPDLGNNVLSDWMGLYTTHHLPLLEGNVVVKRADMPFQMSPASGTGVMQWVEVTIVVDL